MPGFNPATMPTPPDPLDPLLDRWAKTPDPASHLASEVWRRIALTESSSREADGIWAAIAAWLVRPQFATLFVVSCALLGLFLAEVRVTAREREHSVLLARSYLQLIDPLLKAEPTAKLR
jgi:hypothetical protein